MKTITHRDPRELREHPLNATLYGDEPDADLIESVRSSGVVEPIMILADGTVVSGHRRRKAAILTGATGVPCRVADVDPSDAVAVEELLLAANKYREKSNEQKAREFARWKAIEAEKAKRRQATSAPGAPGTPVIRVAHPDAGKARDKAGARVGWSGATGDRAERVIEAIDAAEAAGDAARAGELRDTLNRDTVGAALRKATRDATGGRDDAEQGAAASPLSTDEAEPSGTDEVRLAQRGFNAIIRKLGEIKSEARKLVASDPVAAAWLAGNPLDEFERRVKNAQAVLQANRPDAACGYCGGAKCRHCRETGFLNRAAADSCPATERAR